MADTARTGSPLGDFLKTRRARVTPEQAGIAAGLGLRRTPGLRREEVASLAGISNDYYIRLERGKERNPSPAVVDSLARVLRLEDDEHRHLRELASQLSPDRRIHGDGVEVPVGVMRMLDALRPLPAFVATRTGDYVAWNPSGRRLLGVAGWPEGERNALRVAFGHPPMRALFADWEAQVRGLVYGLRRLASMEPDDAEVAALVAQMREASPDFRRLWEEYVVDTYVTGAQALHHPEVGDLEVEFQVVQVEGEGGLTMMVYHAEPGSREYDAFVRLDG